MKTELVILGGGPAGLTAGLYASRAKVPVVLLERAIPGGQMTATEWVDNYPGFSEPILGVDLAVKMEEHAKRFGLQVEQADITQVERREEGFALKTESGGTYEARAVILATGAHPVKLGIPGELEFAGRGVSYCAVCDAPFFRDVELAVIGGGDSAAEEAVYLTRFASQVHLVHRRDELRAIAHLQERLFAEPKVSIHWSHIPVRINGEHGVDSLTIKSLTDQSERELPVSGVFFYVGIRPNNEAWAGMLDEDGAGFVKTDETMATSMRGIFAAGDLRSKALRQISTAIGDGAIAAYTAQNYLETSAVATGVGM
jgi:thioredoxin reductase (NADPH)